MKMFDFVVVGGGAAGCVVAARLSEDPAHRVLLLEAGGEADRPLVRIPLAWHKVSETARYDWGYRAEPEEATGGRILHQARGRLLGGSSSVNGLMYARGNRGDYDGWAALGLSGWGYDDVLPHFRALESNWRGEGPYHGAQGPVAVVANPKHPVLFPRMIEAARELGYEEVPDFNGEGRPGFGMPDFTVRDGRRESSATSHLAAARNRPNLHVRTGALALRVLLRDGAAVGVEYQHGGRTERVSAGEVVLCGGAYNSPQLLQLSGIGPAAALRAVGIPVRHEAPAVGSNLQDHPLLPAAVRVADEFALDAPLRADRVALNYLRWLRNGSGPLGQAALAAQGFVRTHSDDDWPDTQFQISYRAVFDRPWIRPSRRPGNRLTAAGMRLRPLSRGAVTLRSADPSVPPRIQLNLLAEQDDRRAAREILRFMRRFLAAEALSGLVTGELLPGLDVDDSDAALDAYVRANVMTGMHPAGTCAMGTDPATSVVDGSLRVHGVDGLRVVDASVMPRLVSGNTDAPTRMIAEKAAAIILGQAPLGRRNARSQEAEGVRP
ncbi:GMC family oxidoreductase N-terminal domain-containing protein [Streptomyces phaeochromogenes]|uniref:GMC family oxidoreductase N-terminal domain-containing protein n=1 Tax=Streptomyces phaeochromogenes TaxID=1923 RepID=A0ABZ1HR38_STRPH|nr:GMC family oxidoreductase N-terminal domain-containing protein [Streptomyces phaeochromogenes]WSD19690.1 GMC family oxidoreductase N-terminal domain-containing protein [Streptomyces phaeochromogenes]